MRSVSDSDHEFKAVLGPLFEELSALTPSTMNMDTILTSAEKKKISESMYAVQMPISGSFALELASAMDDLAEGCELCSEYMIEFAARFVYGLWDTIMMQMEIEDE
jgi:hypothetical protein